MWSLSSSLSLWAICVHESAVYDLSILSCSTSLVFLKMSSNHSVPFFICSWRYCSVVNGVLHMSYVLHYQSAHFLHSDYVWPPIVVTVLNLFDDCTSVVHHLHNEQLLKTHGEKVSFGNYHCPLHIWCVLSIEGFILSIIFIGSLFIWGNKPFIGILNNNVAGLGNPAPMSIDLIYNIARFKSLLVSGNFLIVHFTNFMHPSLWPLP